MPDTSSTSPHFALGGAPNFRDLGGHITNDGRQVRHGMVFRSGQLVGLTDADLDQLASLGLRTVVDFRHEYEVGIFGADRLPPGTRLVSLPIAAAGMDASTHAAIRRGEFAALPDLTAANRVFIRRNTTALSELLYLLSDQDNLPLIFHCIGGKDRTGVAAAVVLATLGVPWPAIRDDYLRTNDLIGDAVEERIARLAQAVGSDVTRQASDEDITAARHFFIVEPSYIDAALDEMVSMSGSVEQYVRDDLGVDADGIERLRSTLLEPSQMSSARIANR